MFEFNKKDDKEENKDISKPETAFSDAQLERLRELLGNATNKQPERQRIPFFPKRKGEKQSPTVIQPRPIIKDDNCPFEQYLILAEYEDIVLQQDMEMKELENTIQEIEYLQQKVQCNRADFAGYRSQFGKQIDKILDW
jgi:hypothetical protein